MVEAGTGVGKSFAYLVPAILAAVERRRRSSSRPTRSASRNSSSTRTCRSFARSCPRSSRRPWSRAGRTTSASGGSRPRGKRQGHVPEGEEFDQLAQSGCGPSRPVDGSRADLDFKPLPSVWDAVVSENGNCLGRKCPPHKELLLLQGAATDVDGQHPGRQSCPVRDRPGPAARRRRVCCRTTTSRSSTRPTRLRLWPVNISA